MQITQTVEEPLKRGYTVTMTSEEITALVDEKLTEVQKTAKQPGFREGKVPMNLVKAKYGKAVMGEVLEKAVNDSTMQVVKDYDLRPAMRPKIEVKNFDENAGLEYDMTVDLLPDIEIADMAALEVEKLEAQPEQAQVDEALGRIAQGNKVSEKLEEDRPTQKGDVVLIDFDGSVNGEKLPGMQSEGFELELGSKSFVDTFEEQLEGLKPGDEKTVVVTFPEDYGHDKLKGQEAQFEVKLHELRQSVVPEIDDAFAEKMGLESKDKLIEAVKEQMKKEYDQVSRMHVKRKILDALDGQHTFDVPPSMVDAEFEGIWQQVKGNDDSASAEESTEEERKEFRDIAHRRVKLGLVLAEIGRKNDIEVTNQELQQAVVNEARRYPGQEQQVFEYYQKNPQALEAVKAPVYEDKVIDYILENAKVSVKEVSIEELTKAAEEETA